MSIEIYWGLKIAYKISVLIFAVLSAFFSGAETALVSSSRFMLESLAKNGSKRAVRSLQILENSEDAIGMVLIGNNITIIAATSFIAYIATGIYSMNEKQLVVVALVQAAIFLFFCEISPKIVARARAESYLMIFSFPIHFLMKILKPFVTVSLASSNLIRKVLGIQKVDQPLIRSKDELDLLFQIGEREGLIDEEHQVYISEILSFKEITAYQVLIPTIDIISTEINSSIKNLVSVISETGFSRIPIYEDRVDNIIGYVFYRDIIQNEKVKKISEIMQKPYYIPSTKNIYDLYNEMQETKTPIVFVVNEFGAVIGMVTHEDIAEEIVGEIQTGDHKEDDLVIEINKRKFILRGDLDIDYFEKYFGIEIEKKGFETIGGFITFLMGKIPGEGEKLKYKKNTFIIKEATDRSIEKITLLLSKKIRV